MKGLQKVFYLAVGLLSYALEEAGKAIQQASKTIEEQREKLGNPSPQSEA